MEFNGITTVLLMIASMIVGYIFCKVLHKKESNLIDGLKKALSEDSDYKQTWQANIAMAFKDEFARWQNKCKDKIPTGAEIHVIANKAAKDFLDVLISYK
jgi:hypothetical protein